VLDATGTTDRHPPDHQLRREHAVQIPKDMILEMRRSRGDHDQAGQAESELTDHVDPTKDTGMLARFGINPNDLIGGLGSKFGI
jgi:hypothetical protein